MWKLKLNSSQAKVWCPSSLCQHCLFLKHFYCVQCLFISHFFKMMSGFRHWCCAPHICMTFLRMRKGMQKSVQNCCNKYTSVTSYIFFPSIRIVVVHGKTSISHTFALYLHGSIAFLPLRFSFDCKHLDFLCLSPSQCFSVAPFMIFMH